MRRVWIFGFFLCFYMPNSCWFPCCPLTPPPARIFGMMWWCFWSWGGGFPLQSLLLLAGMWSFWCCHFELKQSRLGGSALATPPPGCLPHAPHPAAPSHPGPPSWNSFPSRSVTHAHPPSSLSHPWLLLVLLAGIIYLSMCQGSISPTMCHLHEWGLYLGCSLLAPRRGPDIC